MYICVCVCAYVRVCVCAKNRSITYSVETNKCFCAHFLQYHFFKFLEQCTHILSARGQQHAVSRTSTETIEVSVILGT